MINQESSKESVIQLLKPSVEVGEQRKQNSEISPHSVVMLCDTNINEYGIQTDWVY